jgi:sugar phosphate isomerase/epimerase
MSDGKIVYSVFTKPWKMATGELGEFVKDLGFEAVELPVRPDYQVNPENVDKELPKAREVLASLGITVASVAGPYNDERTIAACAEAGVPIIRICPAIFPELGYMKSTAKWQKELDSLIPLYDKYGVALGIQNHCNAWIPHALGIRYLIEQYEPKHVCAVWDPAHCALDGEDPRLAVDILWSHLRMVNLKNAYWVRTSGTEAEHVQWKSHWTSGRQGLCSWPLVVQVLKERKYEGVVCLTAEYSDHESVDRLIAEDIAFAKSLFEKED